MLVRMWRKGNPCTVLYWWECNFVQSLWKMVWSFLKKLKMKLSYDPPIPLLSMYWKKTKTLIHPFHTQDVRNESKCPQRSLYMNIHSCFICNSTKLEIAQIPTKWWMDKWTVLYACNEYLSTKEESTSDTCSNMAKSQDNYLCERTQTPPLPPPTKSTYNMNFHLYKNLENVN